MTNVAFIPVRGGSKSIPLKNIKPLLGRPLVWWSAKAANEAKCIDKVIIATDDKRIIDTVKDFKLSKVEIYKRSAENAQDKSSTESVMLEYIKQSDLANDDNFFLIQATSPMLRAEDIDAMFCKHQREQTESAMSGVVSKRFLWTKNGIPLNYDYKNRPRRQDYDGLILENGACYINSIANILRDKNRLSGKITIYEMAEYASYEIDEADDFIIIERLMERYNYKELYKK